MCGLTAYADVKIWNYPDYRIYTIQDAPNRFPATLFTGVDPQAHFVQTASSYAALPPESISDVLITHLPPDHVGGLPVFPNAKIHITKDEYKAWKKDTSRNNPAKFMSKRKNQILFEYDHEVVQNLIAIKLARHTPGHTVFQMRNCYFVGDIVHAADLQISHSSFCVRYDMNPHEATAGRRKGVNVFHEEWFGAHIPFPDKAITP